MRILIRTGFRVLVIAALIVFGATPGRAAGALAIGACAAYGYAYDYPTSEEAQKAALEKCSGDCKQVVTTKNGCVAFAIDGVSHAGPTALPTRPSLAPRRTPRSSFATSMAARTA
jgi:hypothetical protein